MIKEMIPAFTAGGVLIFYAALFRFGLGRRKLCRVPSRKRGA